MKCYECNWLDRSVVLTSYPQQYRCTLGFGSHYADHECEYEFMPIVRCKDCRWYEDPDRRIFENCVRNNRIIPMDPIDFCSYGEREEE